MDGPEIERLGGAAGSVGDSSIREDNEPVIEFVGIDPAGAFGPEPLRDVIIDDGRDGGGSDGSGGGSFGGEPGSGSGSGDGVFGDEYERNLDGSVKQNRDGSPRRKRGRKRGGDSSESGTAKTSRGNLDLSGFSDFLVSIHGMASIAFKAPEWDMEKEEADKIEKASAKFAKHYIGGVVSQKTLDTMQFVSAVGFAYLPRLYLTRERLKEQAMRNATPRNKSGGLAPSPVAPPAPDPVRQPGEVQLVADPSLATPKERPPGMGSPNAPQHAADVPFKMPPGTTFPGQ